MDKCLDASPVAEGIGDLAGVTSEVERDGEAAPDVEQAVGKSLSDLAEQKIMMFKKGGGAVAIAANGAAIEDFDGIRHRRLYRTFPTRSNPENVLAAIAVPRRLAGLFGMALDALLPPRCLGCGGIVDMDGLCAGCWEGIDFLAAPQCDACGLPFELDAGDAPLCGACARKPPPWRRARAVLRYDDAAKGLILRFKHADRTDAAPAFGRWMMRAGADLLAEADVIVPVPMHRWRLWSRRYNQAALLAWAVGREAGVAVAADLLQRHRATPSQGRLGREARLRNVRGAFRLRPARAMLIRKKRVLLVDDVLTSGATVGECTRTLLEGGAVSVDVLTLARVVAPRT